MLEFVGGILVFLPASPDPAESGRADKRSVIGRFDTGGTKTAEGALPFRLTPFRDAERIEREDRRVNPGERDATRENRRRVTRPLAYRVFPARPQFAHAENQLVSLFDCVDERIETEDQERRDPEGVIVEHGLCHLIRRAYQPRRMPCAPVRAAIRSRVACQARALRGGHQQAARTLVRRFAVHMFENVRLRTPSFTMSKI